MMPFPPGLFELIRAFLSAGKTGRIELDVRNGRILSYRLTEAGTVRDDGRVVLQESRN